MNACLDAARRKRGWLIFTLHDVSASPSPFGCTPALLRAALEGAAARGFEIVTVARGARAERARDCPERASPILIHSIKAMETFWPHNRLRRGGNRFNPTRTRRDRQSCR